MAIQTGIFKLKGRIDDLSFYPSKYGLIVRRKGGPDANRIKNHPNFERTREHLSEFAKAGKAAKLIRQAFHLQFDKVADHKMTGRLVKMLLSVIRADKVNARGKRNVMDGAPELLTNFQFNAKTNLRQSFTEEFIPSMNRLSGKMSVKVPSFDPAMLAIPSGATHFKLSSVIAEIDFETENVLSRYSEGPATPISCKSTPEILLTSVLNRTSKPLFISLGIQFFQMVNEELFPLYSAAHNAVAIVQVNGKVSDSVKVIKMQGKHPQVKDRPARRLMEKEITSTHPNRLLPIPLLVDQPMKSQPFVRRKRKFIAAELAAATLSPGQPLPTTNLLRNPQSPSILSPTESG